MDRRDFLRGVVGGAVALSAPRALAGGDPRYLAKMQLFDADHPDDVWLPGGEQAVLKAVVARLSRVQSVVGHGNFHLLGFDAMLAIARGYSRIGAFERGELELLESVFDADPAAYGFYGAKVVDRLTQTVRRNEIAKVPRTGQYLYRGAPTATFERMRSAVGSNLVLTSGIRGLVKQQYLFLRKAVQVGGNLSRASRSLAPPGYSFHAVGDFDVGQKGYGARNFTDDFAASPVARRLVELGYVSIRYPRGNLLGVRFEPWHIRVV